MGLGANSSTMAATIAFRSAISSLQFTGALLDRLTHHVHILEMNGDSFRLAASKKAQRRTNSAPNAIESAANDGAAGAKI
jgi:IstB-like ATP binding protein